MRSHSRAIILASVSTLALSTVSFAQEVQEEQNVIVLDAITITAGGDNGPSSGYVASYNQTGTKTDTPMLETQQSTSVVTQQQIKDQGAENLGEALNYSAGVVGQPYGDDPRFDSPIIRGLPTDEAQYLNGLRMVRAFAAPAIETYGLEQVEVLRGPSSSLFGANEPAGVINQVQKRAQFDDFNEVGLSYGSNDSSSVFFDANRAVNDNVAYRFTGIARDEATQIEEITDKRGYLSAAVRWQADDATLIDFLASYQKDSPITPPGIPFWVTELGDDESLREFYAGYPSADDSDRKMTNIGLEIRREFDNGWQLTQGFRYQKIDWTYLGFDVSRDQGFGPENFGNNPSPDIIDMNSIDQKEDASTINLDTRLSGEATTGSVSHRLLFGLDVRQWDGYARTQFITAPAINWRNPDYDVPVVGDVTYTGVKDLLQTQIGIYAQDEISVGNWRGSVALRHDWSKQTGTSVDTFNGATDPYRKDEATTGRVGLSYVINDEISPYISYATSFLPQLGQNTNLNANGEPLKAKESKQWEAGVKYEPIAFDGFFTAAIYDLTQENVNRFVSVNGVAGTYQIGEVKSRGLELEGTAELANGYSIRASYAYNETEQKGGAEDGNELPNAPKHNAGIWLDKDFNNGFRAGGGVRYIGDRFGNDANTYELDSVTLVDMGASYSRENVEMSLNLNNLTDEAYLASCSNFGCFYGQGREVTAKVSYKW